MSFLLRAQFRKSVYTNGVTEIEKLSEAPYLKTPCHLVENLSNINKTIDYIVDELYYKIIRYQYEKSGKLLFFIVCFQIKHMFYQDGLSINFIQLT